KPPRERSPPRPRDTCVRGDAVLGPIRAVRVGLRVARRAAMTRIFAVFCLSLLACHRPTHDKPAPPESRKGQKHAPETILYVDGAPRASLSWADVLRPGSWCAFLGDVGVAAQAVGAVHLDAAEGEVTPLG